MPMDRPHRLHPIQTTRSPQRPSTPGVSFFFYTHLFCLKILRILIGYGYNLLLYQTYIYLRQIGKALTISLNQKKEIKNSIYISFTPKATKEFLCLLLREMRRFKDEQPLPHKRVVYYFFYIYLHGQFCINKKLNRTDFLWKVKNNTALYCLQRYNIRIINTKPSKSNMNNLSHLNTC